MSEHSFERIALTSDAKYKDIETIDFTPVKEVKMKKVVEKGQRKFWKWLGFIPLIPYKARQDRYTINQCDTWLLYCNSLTLDEIKYKIRSNNLHYFFDKDDKLFREAEVYIRYYNSHRGSEYEYFRTNHQAMDYFNTVKSKCEEVVNELK